MKELMMVELYRKSLKVGIYIQRKGCQD